MARDNGHPKHRPGEDEKSVPCRSPLLLCNKGKRSPPLDESEPCSSMHVTERYLLPRSPTSALVKLQLGLRIRESPREQPWVSLVAGQQHPLVLLHGDSDRLNRILPNVKYRAADFSAASLQTEREWYFARLQAFHLSSWRKKGNRKGNPIAFPYLPCIPSPTEPQPFKPHHPPSNAVH